MNLGLWIEDYPDYDNNYYDLMVLFCLPMSSLESKCKEVVIITFFYLKKPRIHFYSIDIYLFGVIRVYRIFKNLKTAAASVARRTIFFQSMH